MATLFYRHWRISALAVLLIVAAGALSLLTIGRQEDPTITNLFATVVTPFPGADPGRVEALVTEKIEDELQKIAEIDTVESTSRAGVSAITIEVSQYIGDTQIEQTWSEIRDALADAATAFPPGVPEPSFDNDRTGAYTAIAAIQAREGRAVDWTVLRRHADRLADRLRQVRNTMLVELYGERVEEIQVAIDSVALASLGLPAEAVSTAIRAADAKVTAGQVRGAVNDLLVEISGEIDAVARIMAVPLIEADDGRIARVGDIAEVSRGLRQPPAVLALADGEPAVLVAAKMENDVQVDRWSAAIKREIAAFAATLPDGLEHRLLFDQWHYTQARLTDLLGNIALGISLVIGVSLITLGWRAALVVGAVIPLVSLISLAVLNQINVPIHQMSVTGLIVALGLLVDAAIVMTDEIRKRLITGMARLHAVDDAVKRLAAPLLASTVTTVLAFTPMATLPGPAGDFVGAIAIAVIVMLFASLAVALTITPAIVGRFLPQGYSAARAPFWVGGIGLGPLAGPIQGALGYAIRRPLVGIAAGLSLPVMGFMSFPTLTAQFFPGVDRDQLHVQMFLHQGASLAETARAAKAAEDVLRGEDGVRSVHWVIGESAPAFYYNMKANQDGVSRFAEALVTTDNPAATERLLRALPGALDAAVPQGQILVRGLVQGPPVDAPVEMRLVGPNLAELRRLGEEARRILAEVPSVQHTKATLSGGAPKLLFELDEDQTRLAGLDLSAVARQIDGLSEGVTGGSLVEGSEQLPVRVRVGDDRRASALALAGFDVLPANATTLAAQGTYPGVPLSSLGTWRLHPAETPIPRRNGERVNVVQAYTDRDVLPDITLQDFRARLDAYGFTVPPGYRVEWGGDADARDETINNLVGTAGLIVLATLATIVLTFNSLRLSAIALLVMPLSAGLAILALALTGYPFGIQALIGVIGSIGVSINAAIILLTGMQSDAGARAGDPEAILRVVSGSSRHIVSTTATTFGGFLPLILAGGGFWPPFAVAVAGGVLLSAVVNFLFTPAAYALVTPRRESGLPRNVGLSHPAIET